MSLKKTVPTNFVAGHLLLKIVCEIGKGLG